MEYVNRNITTRLFELFLTKKQMTQNRGREVRQTDETRTDGVVKNDHKTSFYNW